MVMPFRQGVGRNGAATVEDGRPGTERTGVSFDSTRIPIARASVAPFSTTKGCRGCLRWDLIAMGRARW